MHLRISHQNNGRTVIQSTEETRDYFVVGASFSIVYLDKTLLIEKTPSGSCICHEPSPRDKEGTFSRVGACVINDAPSFHVADAEFKIEGDLLTWVRPPIWSLPWTTRAPQDSTRECAIKGLASRLRSAKRNLIDPKRVTQAVPAWAKSSMLAGDWKDTVEKFFP